MNEDLRARIVAAYQRLGTISGAARAANVSRDTVRINLKAAGAYDERPLFAGRVNEREIETRPLPKKDVIHRFILTCAQNNTEVNQRVWDNLLDLAEYYQAEVMVSTFTYNKAAYGSKAVKKGTKKASDGEDMWYDPQIEPYISDGPVEVAPGLIWCGEMNILPTASRPLSGLQVYTGRKSGIFPHVKVAMDSIASGKHEPTKFNFTTGTITKRNYIQKKEGLKAEFHHVYGALIAEVDAQGRWYVRQLNADSKGVIYDLDVCVDDGEITTGNRVKSIVWGDIHVATIDKDVSQLAWGEDGMMDYLQPEEQFMHDLVDFRARNGHTFKKGLIHDRFAAYVMGHDSVSAEMQTTAEFLDWSTRDWCKTVVVNSNHDHFFEEWLRIGDYRNDPINAIYFLEAQLQIYQSLLFNPRDATNMTQWALERVNGVREDILFLRQDQSHVLLGIEHGMHGHLGPNGSRGTPGNLARMGRKLNRGHEHSAGIHDGVYTAGITGENDQGYNKGPSSWSPSHIVTYANGKRAIYTIWNGKYKA